VVFDTEKSVSLRPFTQIFFNRRTFPVTNSEQSPIADVLTVSYVSIKAWRYHFPDLTDAMIHPPDLKFPLILTKRVSSWGFLSHMTHKC
jgi:hypothetical protein